MGNRLVLFLALAFAVGSASAAEISLDLVGSIESELEFNNGGSLGSEWSPGAGRIDADTLTVGRTHSESDVVGEATDRVGWLFFDTMNISGTISSAKLRMRVDSVDLLSSDFGSGVCGTSSSAPWSDAFGGIACDETSLGRIQVGSYADNSASDTYAEGEMTATRFYDDFSGGGGWLEIDGPAHSTVELGEDDEGHYIDFVLGTALISQIESGLGNDWAGLSVFAAGTLLNCAFADHAGAMSSYLGGFIDDPRPPECTDPTLENYSDTATFSLVDAQLILDGEVVNAVPVPAAAPLMLSALGLLGWYRRRH